MRQAPVADIGSWCVSRGYVVNSLKCARLDLPTPAWRGVWVPPAVLWRARACRILGPGRWTARVPGDAAGTGRGADPDLQAPRGDGRADGV